MIVLLLFGTMLRRSFIATTSPRVLPFPAFLLLWMRNRSRHCASSFALICWSEQPPFPALADCGIVAISSTCWWMWMEPDKSRALVLLRTSERCQSRSVVWLRWRSLATQAANAEQWFGRAPRSCKRIPINGSARIAGTRQWGSAWRAPARLPGSNCLCEEASASSQPDPAPLRWRVWGYSCAERCSGDGVGHDCTESGLGPAGPSRSAGDAFAPSRSSLYPSSKRDDPGSVCLSLDPSGAWRTVCSPRHCDASGDG